MSSATAELRTPLGELVAYGVYSGTSDVLGPNLSHNIDEAWEYDKGRGERPDGRNAWDVLRDCEHALEAGYLYSDYGSGFWWPVEFCRECMVNHGPLAPWEILEGSDAPEGWMGNWPKDGRPPIEGTVATPQLEA